MDYQLPCPTWCDGEHLADPAMDQIHERLAEPVPVIMLNRRIDGRHELSRLIEATEFEIVAYQYVGDDETWITIVDGEQQRQRIEISLESAWRLAKAMTELLSEVRRGVPGSSGR